ncbi:hypothetical protein KEM55_000113 [Ascosphaera atra]|nr:hypothetical protein KEM55_000113 [Ascosphaera atra]
MCILGGDWRFPDERPSSSSGKAKGGSAGRDAGDGSHGISEPVKDVVRRCLRVEPSERPDIDELIEIIQNTIAALDGRQ